MLNTLSRLAGALTLVLLLAAPALAQVGLEAPKAAMTLVSAQSAAAPGQTVRVGLHQVIAPGWHTYWVNPGDAAEPPKIDWTHTQGVDIGPFSWPAPATFLTGEGQHALVSHVYENEVILPFSITLSAALRPGDTVRLAGTAVWQVCDDRTCIWEEAPVALAIPIAAVGREDADWAARLAAVDAALPRPMEGVTATITREGVLSMAGPALAAQLAQGPVRNAHFFAFDRETVNPNAPQQARQGPAGMRFHLTPTPAEGLGETGLAGVVAFDHETPQGWARRGFEIRAQPGAALAQTDATAIAGGIGGMSPLRDTVAGAALTNAPTLAVAMALAVLAGLILNVMPCVFPILSIKAISLAQAAASGAAREHGAWFFLGVMATFLGLAGLLSALQAGGAALGWGFQAQNAWFMGALALVFFLVGLNLLGAFEIGGALQNVGGGLAGRDGGLGAFFTGALAVVAATPCTIPFMAAPITFALTQPAVPALLVFAAMGVGFAAPVVALSFAPGLQRLMARPGAWMTTLRQGMAFPMFAASAWATWVAGAQAGALGVLVVLLLATILGFLVWAARAVKTAPTRAAVVALAIAGIAGVWGLTRPAALTPERWSPERVAALQAQGRAVFVNFTADWCVNCKVNERVALSSQHIARAFADRNVTYMKADLTTPDPQITYTLSQYGRMGVPLYLYYGTEGALQPEVLPQVLSEAVVLNAIQN